MTISLRNLPPELERAILETSKREGLSLNKAAIRLLETALPSKRQTVNHDFDEFFGKWTADEAATFDAALADMRRIVPGDWK